MAFTIDDARAYIAQVRWQFAKTMPQWPHEYTVRAWRRDLEHEFFEFVVLIRRCGTGRVTEALLAFVPRGRVLAMDASADMVALARRRLGDRVQVWCEDVLDLDLDEPVDAIVSTATLHWVTDTTVYGRGWPAGCGQVGCSRSSVEERATSQASAKSSTQSPATSRQISLAGRPGHSRAHKRRSGACGRRALPRPGAG